MGGSVRSFQCTCLREIFAGDAIGRSPGCPRVVSALPAAALRRSINFLARRLLWTSLEAEACCEPACAQVSVSDRLDPQKSVFGVPRLGRVALPPEIVHRHSGASRSSSAIERTRGERLTIETVCAGHVFHHIGASESESECCSRSAAACQIVLLSSSSSGGAEERFELGQVSCACLRRLLCLVRWCCIVTAWCCGYRSCPVESWGYVGATIS